jgi:Fe-S-cluster containining protein
VQRERVYFTWPDRGLRYECRGCGACCKGHGIGIDAAAGELVQLVGKRPELAAFVRKRGESTTAFNPRDRCWFLEDDGLCRVEIEDGRAAKPAACRLFPFNRVFRAGTYTIVDYNSVICPLAVAADDGVTHDEILAEIATLRDPGLVGSVPADDALIARERAIADAMFATRTLDAACAAQELTDRELPGFEALVGLPWRAPEGATLAAALALTPSLRFNELYGPRQYAPRAKMPPVLARMWLAWLGFAQLGAELARRTLGMQELTTIWSEQAPVMHALARWRDVPTIKPGKLEAPADPLARALAEKCLGNRRSTLGELVAATLGSASPAARIAAMKSAEPVLRAAFG